MAYDIGDQPRLTMTFTDIDGVLADPTDFTLTLQKPSGIEITKIAADCTHQSTGVYYWDQLLTESGRWQINVVSTGATVAAEQTQLDVRESNI
jgi:hypothetical protein